MTIKDKDNGRKVLLALFVVILITAMVSEIAYAYIDCNASGGTLVRGLIWFECVGEPVK